ADCAYTVASVAPTAIVAATKVNLRIRVSFDAVFVFMRDTPSNLNAVLEQLVARRDFQSKRRTSARVLEFDEETTPKQLCCLKMVAERHCRSLTESWRMHDTDRLWSRAMAQLFRVCRSPVRRVRLRRRAHSLREQRDYRNGGCVHRTMVYAFRSNARTHAIG